MRKRCRRGVQEETEEPPAKKLAVDRQESEDREDLDRSLSDATAEKVVDDEQQKEQGGEENGNTLMDVEVEKRMKKQFKEAGQEKVENKEKQEENGQLRTRKDCINDERDEKLYSPPTGSADQDDE